MTFEPKIPTIGFRFLSKICEYWTDVHLRIVKLKSGGQQLPILKKNLSRNSFNLEKSPFLLKLPKNIRFNLNHRMLNSYTFALSKIEIKSLDSTINKRKQSLHTHTQPEKITFLSKNHKNTAFWPKMCNSQQECIWIKYRSDKFKSNHKVK